HETASYARRHMLGHLASARYRDRGEGKTGRPDAPAGLCQKLCKSLPARHIACWQEEACPQAGPHLTSLRVQQDPGHAQEDQRCRGYALAPFSPRIIPSASTRCCSSGATLIS